MITFSTEFPLDPKHSATDVLRLACEWLTGSPHTTLVDSEFDELPVDDAREIPGTGESVTIASARGPDFTIAGLQYRRAEELLEWVTSIVARQDSTETLFSLQVSCEAYGTAPSLPPPKKPYFIKQALTVLGGGTDGEIPVADKPFHLSEGEAAIAAALIKGVAKNRLPIVYLSRTFDNNLSVDPNGLATYISGLGIPSSSRTHPIMPNWQLEVWNGTQGKTAIYAGVQARGGQGGRAAWPLAYDGSA